METPQTAPAPDPGKIFVSYSRVDFAWVDALVQKLEAAGLSVWLDVHKLLPGTAWDTEIERALHGTGVLMVILSPDSVKSRNVLDEISFALGKNRLVVPVLYRPCEVPYRVARLQHVDFTGEPEAALTRLTARLKAAVEESRAAASSDASLPGEAPAHLVPPHGAPDVTAARAREAKTTHLFGRLGDTRKLPARFLSLLVLPTAILLALAVGANYWRVATDVRLEVVTRRASFAVRGDQPQDLLNLAPQFSELRVEECGSMSFSAAEFSPVTDSVAADRVQAVRRASASTRVTFTCAAGSTITLTGAEKPRGLVGVLDHVRVVPGATVVLDVYGANDLVLTVDVSTKQALHIPIHSELKIVTDLADLTEPPTPPAVRGALKSGLATYRARLHENNTYLDLQTGARTVLVVTPLPESAKDFFRSDTPLPVDSLQFLGEALGVDTPTPLRRGKISYAGHPGIPPLEFSDEFLVLSRTSDMYIRSLAFDPEGLKLILDGRILRGAIGTGKRGTPKGSRWLDPRLTALQAASYGPRWRVASVAALWLAATLAMWWVVSRRSREAAPGAGR